MNEAAAVWIAAGAGLIDVGEGVGLLDVGREDHADRLGESPGHFNPVKVGFHDAAHPLDALDDVVLAAIDAVDRRKAPQHPNTQNSHPSHTCSWRHT